MKSLTKFTKKQLISLTEQYETDIKDLTDDLEKLSLTPDRVEYIYLNSEDDKIIVYLKSRLKCVRGLKRLPYLNEYNRLLNL